MLKSSQNLLAKIFDASDKSQTDPQLVSVATDGETFGHHKRHAERTLALFLRSLAPSNNLQIENFGNYLKMFPSQYEVKLKPGENGEGTSWSCPHGVKRWYADCGCGGGGEWNQKWRKPLRDTLNWLRDQLIIIFENLGKQFFPDVWKARNDYIALILQNTPEKRNSFFKSNDAEVLSDNEINAALKLLEIQKNSMLMFTSCGWFFSEISGIETVKILEYAAKAIDLAEELTGISLEEEFINKLSEAKSNIPKFTDGKEVFQQLVKPNRMKK